MITLLRLLAKDTLSVFRWRLPYLILLMVMSGLFEGLAMATALPLLQSLSENFNASRSFETGFSFLSILQTTIMGVGLPNNPTGIGIFMGGLVIFSAIFYLLMARLSASMQVTYVLRWQTDIFQSSLSAGPKFIEKFKSGEVIASIVTEVARVGGAFYHGSILLASSINLVVYLTVSFFISPTATISIIIVGLILFALTRPLMKNAFSYGKEITRAQSEIQTFAEEGISCSKAIKVGVAEDFINLRFKGEAENLADANFKNAFDIQKAKAVFEYGGVICLTVILIVSPIYLNVEVSVILVVLALFVRLLPRISALQQSLQALSALLPALLKVSELRQEAQNCLEAKDRRPLPKELTEKPLQIEFQNVFVSKGNKDVLVDLNFKVLAGKTTAIVGPSGSGKSTIIDALLGITPMRAGRIAINKIDLLDVPLPAFRNVTGYVAQDTTIISGSVAENVSFGKNLVGSKIEDALKRSAAHFVDYMEGGLNTSLGNKGSRLSGGEKQRISLARAISVPRQLFIFDEATSALDSKTEAEVLETVINLSGESTLIVIAHRFSAVKNADHIIVLEEGSVVEQGNWSELNRKGSRFHSLLKLQELKAH